MFGSASPGMVRIWAVPSETKAIRVDTVPEASAGYPSGEERMIASRSGDPTGNFTCRDAMRTLGSACTGASCTMRSDSSASRRPMRRHSSQVRASPPPLRRLSAVTMPPWAEFMKIPMPPPASAIRS